MVSLIGLRIHDEDVYEISIPKSTQLFFSSSEDIAIEYLTAAYVGQELAEITDKFEYNEIQPQDHESISFFVEKADPIKLAEILFCISVGFGSGDEEDSFSFNEGVSDFADKIAKKKVAVACPYFIQVYKEHKTRKRK